MKLIVRLKGGVGNQLYSYAAAKRLAIANDAQLVIDDVSGFARDAQYRRSYRLDRFNISARFANSFERYEPFERPRRALAKYCSRIKDFDARGYIEQESDDFDDRLLSLNLSHKTTTIDGLWQSELYFKDIESHIRAEYTIVPPTDYRNLIARDSINSCHTTALHVRWFNQSKSAFNASVDYYKRAIDSIRRTRSETKFVIFSDNPLKAANLLQLKKEESISIDWNNADGGEIDDLWLMTLCNDYIIANSTFSWWGAWLGANSKSLVYFPREKMGRSKWAWDYVGQIPSRWIPIVENH